MVSQLDLVLGQGRRLKSMIRVEGVRRNKSLGDGRVLVHGLGFKVLACNYVVFFVLNNNIFI